MQLIVDAARQAGACSELQAGACGPAKVGTFIPQQVGSRAVEFGDVTVESGYVTNARRNYGWLLYKVFFVLVLVMLGMLTNGGGVRQLHGGVRILSQLISLFLQVNQSQGGGMPPRGRNPGPWSVTCSVSPLPDCSFQASSRFKKRNAAIPGDDRSHRNQCAGAHLNFLGN